MSHPELYVLEAGFVHLDKSVLTYLTDFGTRVRVPVPMYLIKTDGGNVLFDTGLCPLGLERPNEIWGVRAANVEMRAEDDVRHRLSEMGLSTRDIRYVVQSHLHWDHCGGLQFFGDSTIVLQRAEYRFAYCPDPYEWRYFDSHIGPARGFDFLLLDGDAELVPGVKVISTPGHTFGHQSLVVDLGEAGTAVLAGDAVYTLENADRRILPGIFVEARAAWNSMARLIDIARSGGGILCPSHDPGFFGTMEKAPNPFRRPAHST